MRSIFTLVVLLTIVSCCSTRQIGTSIKENVRIEVRTEYVNDTIIREIPIISESITTRDTSSHLENFYAFSDARINANGTLFHSLATKPQKESIPIFRPVEYRDSVVYRTTVVKEQLFVERDLSWWQQTQIRGFWVLVIVLAFICRRDLFALIRKLV